jgi:hypothetical protein
MLGSRWAAIFSPRLSIGERARFERYVVDEAWKLEEEFWAAGKSGHVHQYYARVLAADAFVVVPGHVLVREDLLRQWQERAAWEQYSLSEQRIVMVNGETVVLTYRVNAQQSDDTPYRARVSSMYTWVGGGWALAFRQHTPDPDLDVGPIR